jgi:tripartite-type tricarboxylate transporter receptor subunit TctC
MLAFIANACPLLRGLTTIVLTIVCWGGPTSSWAQEFPENRPITLVVPFAAGGGTDGLARDLARVLQEKLRQTIVIDNKGGAGGTIAGQQVATAKPDGHTLLFATSTFVTAATAERKLPYDIEKDFSPIAMLGRGPMLVVANKATGIKTIQDLIERAKAAPDKLNFVSSGTGSITHLAGELFLQRTGTKMTHIPYRGSGPALVDLLSGQGHIFFATVATILGQVQGNTVTVIAATGRNRSSLFPDLPTVEEGGVKDYNVSTWWGIIGPAGLSKTVISRLNALVNEAAGGDALAKRFADEGAEPFKGRPDDFGMIISQELRGWRDVVQEGSLKLN